MTMLQRDALAGSWKLLSAQGRMSDTGERVDLLGPDPRGFCMFDSEGRWMVVTTRSDTPAPASDAACRQWLGHGMVAFTGRYEMQSDTITVTVDVAWNPALAGARMPRVIAIDGTRMTITQPEWEHPFFPGRRMTGIVTWQKEDTLPGGAGSN